MAGLASLRRTEWRARCPGRGLVFRPRRASVPSSAGGWSNGRQLPRLSALVIAEAGQYARNQPAGHGNSRQHFGAPFIAAGDRLPGMVGRSRLRPAIRPPDRLERSPRSSDSNVARWQNVLIGRRSQVTPARPDSAAPLAAQVSATVEPDCHPGSRVGPCPSGDAAGALAAPDPATTATSM